MKAALAAGAPLVWPEFGSNVAFECDARRQGGDRRRLRQGRAVIADRDRQQPARRQLHGDARRRRRIRRRRASATRSPSAPRAATACATVIAKDILQIAAAKIRVITPDVGGGFGTKSFVYHEYPLAAIAAKRARPAGQVDRRARASISSSTATAATTSRSPRWRWTRTASSWPCASTSSPTWAPICRSTRPFIPEGGLTMPTGVYDIPRLYALCRGVYTNTVPVDAYRGAGRPEAAYLIERLVDVCGRDTGLGPIEIRRRNFIRRSRCPTGPRAGASTIQRRVRRPSRAGARVADWKPASRRAPRPRSRRASSAASASPPMSRPAPSPATKAATVTLNDDGTGDAPHRHPDQRPGPRHRLCPVHRRPSRPRLRQDRGDPGRHRPGAERRGHRRLALDPARRRLGRPGRDQARRAAQAAGRRTARGRGRGPRARRRHGRGSPAPTAA